MRHRPGMVFGARAGLVSAQSVIAALGLAAVLLALATVERASPANAAARPVSLVVDTDLGSDDVLALVFLTGRRDVALRAVTVSGTGLARCPGGARRAARILRALGHPNVPVACGRQDPLTGFNSFPVEWRDGAARLGASLPTSPGQVSRLAAADLLEDAVRRSAGPDTLLTLGPLTNVAEALRRHPSLRSGIARIVTMGGAVGVPGNIGPGHDHAEYNLWVDPRAAREVLTSGIPATYIPLDATNDVPVSPLLAREISRRSGRPAAVARQAQAGLFPGSFYWDPLAAATLVDPAVVATRRLRLVVRETGDSWNGSLRRAADGTPALVAMSARRERFELLLLRGVTRDGKARIALPSAAVTIDARPGSCAVAAAVSRPGSGWVRVRNRTRAPLVGGLVRLLDGKTLVDLQEFLRTLKPGDPPPAWVTVAAFAAAPGGEDAWVESKLTAGTYAAVCFTGTGVGRTAPTTFELG